MRHRLTISPLPALAGAVLFLAGGPVMAQGPYVDHAAGELGTHVCGLDAAGGVDCASEFGYSRTDPPPDLPASTSIGAGVVHTCGITVDGAVRCWGDDFFG